MYVNKRIMKETTENFLVFVLAIGLFAGVIALQSIFGGAIMSFFGSTYTSYRSVIKFFVVGAIVSWPISLTAEAIPKLLCYDYKLIPKWQAVMIYVMLATLATSAGLLLVNRYMKTVAANKVSVGVVSFLYAMFNSRGNILDRPQDT